MTHKVPDHILDKAAETAERYYTTKWDRLTVGMTDEQKEVLRQKSTHQHVRAPDRRELHRRILESCVAHLDEEIPDEEPILIYVAGPMAAGKSTLLAEFDARIKAEAAEEGPKGQRYGDWYLESVFQDYAKYNTRPVESDFEAYKKALPEFTENDNNFALIRAEASGLDVALTQWAQELNAHTLMAQLGSADNMEEFVRKKAENYRVVMIGVTADPNLNLERLHARNAETGKKISDEELAKTISEFPDTATFRKAARHADKAVLVESLDPGFATILAAGLSLKPHESPLACDKFDERSNASKEALLARFQQAETLEAEPVDLDISGPYS